MSRSLRRLRNWPDCLIKLTDEDLKAERTYWNNKINYLGHAEAKKGAAKLVRDVEKEMNRRESERNQG